MTNSPTPLGESRDAFLARVRQALGRPSTPADPPAPPAVDSELVRLAAPGPDLLDLFAQRARSVGMNVLRIKGANLTREVATVLANLNAKRVATSAGSLPQALALNESLRRKGLVVVDWKSSPTLEAQYDLDAGITDVHAALAETGSIICSVDAGHSRGLSLVPTNHIALVRRSDILPDMVDFWARWRANAAGRLPSSIAVITGPSKTADIEGELVVGVHGPARVDILLIEDA